MSQCPPIRGLLATYHVNLNRGQRMRTTPELATFSPYYHTSPTGRRLSIRQIHTEKPLRMHDLVHYVHSLLATCTNPRDFHGVNVVKLLKKAMGRRQMKGLFVSPAAYLALCNAGDAPDNYLRRLKNMAYKKNDEPRWLGNIIHRFYKPLTILPEFSPSKLGWNRAQSYCHLRSAQSCTTAVGDGTRNFEPWSSDEDDT
ncbi:uncharacterized protein TNCV_457071 [Trichonephila clavipes]|nr:uncharacterized protein TNCV_457071 [Trichonephila clavipes]